MSMRIMIKGMNMPKNCHECQLFESKYHCHGCHAVPKSFNDMDMWNFVGDRPSWCPLIELPPHGRLIDAKVFRNSCYKHYSDFIDGKIDGKTALLNIEKEIIDAPTIIEAEGE